MKNLNKLKVNFVGHVDRQTGYGRAARDWCRALTTDPGIDLGVATFDEGPEVEKARCDNFHDEHDYPDVVVIHERIPWAPGAPGTQSAADYLTENTLHEWLDCRDWASAPTVLATAWEVRGLPGGLSDYLSQYAAVVVPSEQSRSWLCYPMHQQVRHGARVRVVPHAIDLDFWEPGLQKSREVALTNPTRFLYVGQWNDRKYPAGVLKAYLASFGHVDRESIHLHLHCPGMTEAQMLEAKGILASSGIPPEELPPLSITTEYLSLNALRELYWRSDVFVTAARGEGFNLPALEAAACGCEILSTEAATPVFAFDDVEGHIDGVNTVGGTMVPVFPGGSVRVVGGGVAFESSYPRGVTCRQQWSEPDLGHLAGEMRESLHQERSTLPRELLVERFSYQSVGQQFAALLREVVDKKGTRR